MQQTFLRTVLKQLDATEQGLTSDDAERRLVRYGFNEPTPTRRTGAAVHLPLPKIARKSQDARSCPPVSIVCLMLDADDAVDGFQEILDLFAKAAPLKDACIGNRLQIFLRSLHEQ